MATPKKAPIESNIPQPQAQPETAATADAAAAARGTFAIEDDVPLPVKRVGVPGESMYPFDKLAIGQSFFVPATEKIAEPWKTLTSMASRMAREHYPKKFVTARENDKAGTAGVRIWRTADATEPLEPPKKREKKAGAEPKEGSKEALAAEAVAGDTSRKQPEPEFT